jgi:hypothetical protein
MLVDVIYMTSSNRERLRDRPCRTLSAFKAGMMQSPCWKATCDYN